VKANKAVCERCFIKLLDEVDLLSVKYAARFSSMWDRGRAMCRHSGRVPPGVDVPIPIAVSELPPEECPFLAEHVVSQ